MKKATRGRRFVPRGPARAGRRVLRAASARAAALLLASAIVLTARTGKAQGDGTLPELPPPAPPAPSDPAAAPATPPPAQPTDPPAQAPVQQPPPSAAPPVVAYEPPPEPKHAPMFSFWTGGRLGVMGFGYNFYNNELGQPETTGNFAGNGPVIEVDAGARLGKRYVPFLFLEHGFLAQGHRFTGSEATTSSDLYGIGFRYTAGDVNSAGFLTEISVGVRRITVRNGSETYRMSGLEIFRLGLGAEIRISTLFVLSPMAMLSGGSFTDTEGSVQFSPEGSRDGLTQPTFRNGRNIVDQRGYVVLGIGMGAHFDVFGK